MFPNNCRAIFRDSYKVTVLASPLPLFSWVDLLFPNNCRAIFRDSWSSFWVFSSFQDRKRTKNPPEFQRLSVESADSAEDPPTRTLSVYDKLSSALYFSTGQSVIECEAPLKTVADPPQLSKLKLGHRPPNPTLMGNKSLTTHYPTQATYTDRACANCPSAQ